MARITVEDCLVKENNRFALVMLATHRAKQLLSGAKTLIDNKGNKSIVSALREIAASKVRFMTPEDIAEEQRILAEARRQAEEREAAGIIETPEVPTPHQNGSHQEKESALSRAAFSDDTDGVPSKPEGGSKDEEE